jgi:hypothetical protein
MYFSSYSSCFTHIAAELGAPYNAGGGGILAGRYGEINTARQKRPAGRRVEPTIPFGIRYPSFPLTRAQMS